MTGCVIIRKIIAARFLFCYAEILDKRTVKHFAQIGRLDDVHDGFD